MDIAHKDVWFRVTTFGGKESTLIHEGGFSKGILAVMRHISAAPNRYGPGSIEFDFSPMSQHVTEQEASFATLMAGLDFSNIEDESPEEAAKWAGSPMNVDSDSYDPIFVMYQQCHVASFRDTKTPEDLAILRKHVESKYQGSGWWDGSHKW